MAEVIRAPELRYTPDGQMAIAEMVVQFPGARDSDPAETLKVLGWGNVAQEIQSNYQVGDRVVVEGRLSINTVERPEGFRDKVAELTAQRVYLLGAGTVLASTPAAPTTSQTASQTMPQSMPQAAPQTMPQQTVQPMAQPAAQTPMRSPAPRPTPTASAPPAPRYEPPAYSDPEPNYDDIPF